MWALGDYHRFATETVWELGPVLVEACAITAGQRVLDVAAGTGNVAIRAAEAGARVVASDLTPENFEAGRREARARGVELEWVEADAEALPFGDGEFDVVTSSVGAIFAPDHQAVADELVRVCRPGGTIGMINFTPEGLAGDFFGLFGRHAPPPPPGAAPPVAWGSEAHVRELFGDRVAVAGDDAAASTWSAARTARPATAGSSRRPSARRSASTPRLAGEPDRLAALDRDFLDVRHAREPRSGRRSGRVPLRVPARRRAPPVIPRVGAGKPSRCARSRPA